ncbi:MAG: TonB-dependent receptor [Bacteroidetes bacterium]|nr:TonB-dependent receptor [Bacteroidota bacterium]MBU1115967.1 TonB-dependent receptor [Bacteroidota bacterium]MBU1798436.1 TonB-dependent receptor [Bacteroidota bacterium]
MKKLLTFSIILFISVFTANLFAQSSAGKLAGKVVDAETQEPLIGANIVILNTSLGAACDIDGNYFILNITPGTYDVQISFVGYTSKVIQEVRVIPGVTYELNTTLSPGIAMEEIVVSDKKFFEEKSTNTVKVVDADQIDRLPVRGVTKLASLQAGVVMAEGSGGADGNGTINVRGGRGGEVLYIVDGVPQNDSFFGTNYAQVSNAAVDQLSFQIGGFEAKYGQAQSGIINITTKSGSPKYNLFADVVSSSFTDAYGYNLYTMSFGGPIVPGVKEHTFFLSGEKGWFLDSDPRAIPLVIPSVKLDSDYKPNMNSESYRMTARTSHDLKPFTLRLGGTYNYSDYNTYTHSYAKSNAHHYPKTIEDNLTISARLSQTVSSNSFWNLNTGYRNYNRENGDGQLFDNIEAYGDPDLNPELVNEDGTPAAVGSRLGLDRQGSFFKKGRVSNNYNKSNNKTFYADFDFTSQIDNHLFEVGAGAAYDILRRYIILPVKLAENKDVLSYKERLALRLPTLIGYDVFGNESDEDTRETVEGFELDISAKPKTPLTAYAYIQDRFELDDIVLNLGLRMDYFDSQQDVLRDEALPYVYGDPDIFDPADFVRKDAELFFSPRIGLGFPVTQSTVFHAQYGKFIQRPNIVDVVTSVNDLSGLINDGNFGVNTGVVNSQTTTQYEIGFRQVLGDNVAGLNVTAFYKNTKGLINDQTIFFRRSEGGQIDRYYRPTNADFGTVKGVALSLNVSSMNYISLNIDYTYSMAEGTGSSTGSATMAAFRNTYGETPKVIAPLDFDQRHTGVVNVSFFVPEGDLGLLEMSSLTLLYSFNSGRPYTPLLTQNIVPGGESNLGETKGYVNSAFGPGSNRIDLKLEKSFKLFEDFYLSPYLWVENVLGAENAVNIYRSTGSAYSSGYLSTEQGKSITAQINGYAEDYKALELDPTNFGIPRTIKLGVKVRFSNFGG